MDEIKKGIKTYIRFWRNSIEIGSEYFWHMNLTYWDAIYKYLDTPFHIFR